jgi:DNA-binding XRE family transcriptional regulator
MRHNVARLRQALSLSQKDFAGVINRSEITVKSIETGRLKLSKNLATLIAARTGAEADWLLRNNLTEPMPPFEYVSAKLEPAELAYNASCALLYHLFDRLLATLARLKKTQLRSDIEVFIEDCIDKLKAVGQLPDAHPIGVLDVDSLEFFKEHPESLDPDLASLINLDFLIKEAYRMTTKTYTRRRLKALKAGLSPEERSDWKRITRYVREERRRRKSLGRSQESLAPSDRHKSPRSSAGRRDGVR